MNTGENFTIQGVWINKNTGEKVIVKDSFIGDTGMQIITNEGALLDINDFSKNYMQASDEIYDESGHQIGTEEIKDEDLGIQKNYKNDLFAVFEGDNTSTGIIDKTKYKDTLINTPKKQKHSTNYDVINKFFGKFDTKINIDFNIDWTGIPKEGLVTLIEYLDIDEDEISDYIYENFLDKESLRNILSEKISDYLKN